MKRSELAKIIQEVVLEVKDCKKQQQAKIKKQQQLKAKKQQQVKNKKQQIKTKKELQIMKRKKQQDKKKKKTIKQAYFQGDRITNLINAIGYDDFSHFITDNPGCEQVIIQWIQKGVIQDGT